MTYKGQLMSIDRHGINRGDIGPLAKSSFEETTDMLINASIFSEYDNVNGVSANVMLGQVAPCGTGDSEILLDEEYLQDLIEKTNFNVDVDYNSLENEIEIDDCELSEISFNYNINKNDKKCVSFNESKIIIN
jgi:DNA-directed RNA polymerase beta' subunit